MKTVDIVVNIVIPLVSAILSIACAAISLSVANKARKEKEKKKESPTSISIQTRIPRSPYSPKKYIKGAVYTKLDGKRFKAMAYKSRANGPDQSAIRRRIVLESKLHEEVIKEVLVRMDEKYKDEEFQKALLKQIELVKNKMQDEINSGEGIETSEKVAFKDTVQQ